MPYVQQIFLLTVAALAIVMIFYFVLFRRSKWREELGDTADLDPARDETEVKYRDGPTLRYGSDTPRIEELHTDTKWSSFRPMLDRPRFVKQPLPVGARITLTPRHLEHVNILRRRDGKLPLNENGFRAAIARQATAAEPRAVRSTDDWALYLIEYAAPSSEHQQHRVAVDHTIVIAPDEPFNGQAGTFGGAGATSSFDTPVSDPAADRDELGKVATRGMGYGSASGFAAGLAAAGADPVQPDPSDGGPEAYSPPQPEPERSDPEPSSSAPDPTPTDSGGSSGGSD